jgi:uncharacterized protein (DUF924 family)
MDATVFDAVHEYWFGPLAEFDSFPVDRFRIWFGGGADVDSEIAEKFGTALKDVAAASELTELTPKQSIGRIVLLDQMSRNIHRNSPQAYALDPLSQRLARDEVNQGLDRFKLIEKAFIILALGHSEVLSDQDLSVALFLSEIEPHIPSANRFYEAGRIQGPKYREIIDRFGRFPHRNAVLGRESTADELAFLAEAKIAPF